MSPNLPTSIYRVTRKDYATTADIALSGAGGLYDDGRWHYKGQPIVYTSQSSSLCLLERLVHADEWIAEAHPDRVMLTLNLPPVSYIWYDPEELRAKDQNWRQEGSTVCRNLGHLWLTDKISCALMVPSAANLAEFNILLNPKHPEYQMIISANATLSMALVELDERVVSLARAKLKAAS